MGTMASAHTLRRNKSLRSMNEDREASSEQVAEASVILNDIKTTLNKAIKAPSCDYETQLVAPKYAQSEMFPRCIITADLLQ